MIKKIFALPVIEQISPVLSRRKLDELDLIVVDHPQVKASFALQGAHLLSWKPAGEEEVLWLSNSTISPCTPALSWVKPVKSILKHTANLKLPLLCIPTLTWVISLR